MKINAKTDLKSDNKVLLSMDDAKVLGLTGSHQEETAYVALKYFDFEHQCFSEWDKKELKAFSQFIRKLNQQSWLQIQGQGGKPGNKVGMGYTIHKNHSVLPNKDLRDKFSPDINFFELRVTDEARVHGFRVKNVFFLVWLDRNHEVYPQ